MVKPSQDDDHNHDRIHNIFENIKSYQISKINIVRYKSSEASHFQDNSFRSKPEPVPDAFIKHYRSNPEGGGKVYSLAQKMIK